MNRRLAPSRPTGAAGRGREAHAWGCRARLATLGVALLLTLPVPAAHAEEVAVGTPLHGRLRQTLSSYGSQLDERVVAAVIAPVVVDGRVLIPLGAEALGRVTETKRVGLGLSRETARLRVTFDTLRLPDGSERPLAARIAALDNARETVDDEGTIEGIRATASFAAMVSGAAVSIGLLNPMLLGFTMASSLSVFRLPESEIILPAGSEMRLELQAPLELSHDFGLPAPPAWRTPDAVASATAFVRSLPFRTVTESTSVPSDLTNLLFLGDRDALARAWDAAGWGQTDTPGGRANYAALRAIVENQGYREAPMSVLLLDGQRPQFTYAKTLNTFFSRHHARVFGSVGSFDGLPAWTASSTHDVGIGFSRLGKTFIHVIDENIDEERDKIVYDLILTGCVASLDYLDRPWLPADASNSTGDRLLTDRRIAVVRLNGCTAPRRADAEAAVAEPPLERPPAFARGMRNVTLTLKNDAFRGNIVYQGYSGIRRLWSVAHPQADAGASPSFTAGGQEFLVVRGAPRHDARDLPSQRVSPRPTYEPLGQPKSALASRLEYSFSAGNSGFHSGRFSTQPIGLDLPGVGVLPGLLDAETSLANGWSIAPKVTFNHGRFLAHEFGYTYASSEVRIQLPDSGLSAPIGISQFNYNLLVNLTRNGARIRPYLAAGPAMQTLRLKEATTGTSRALRFAFSEARFLVSTWEFGTRPPLEGGGVFQFAGQWGGGVKVHLTPHILWRIDYRETFSAQPDFWTESHDTLRNTLSDGDLRFEPSPLITHGPMRHQRLSTGFGVAF